MYVTIPAFVFLGLQIQSSEEDPSWWSSFNPSWSAPEIRHERVSALPPHCRSDPHSKQPDTAKPWPWEEGMQEEAET